MRGELRTMDTLHECPSVLWSMDLTHSFTRDGVTTNGYKIPAPVVLVFLNTNSIERTQYLVSLLDFKRILVM